MEVDVKYLISYVDKRFYSGEGYEKVGFKKIGETPPNFFYINQKNVLKRESRIKYQKHKLPKIIENYDSEKTGHVNMNDNGFYRIYDCGNIKYLYEK